MLSVAYSEEFKKKVVAFALATSYGEAAEKYDVGKGSIARWVKKFSDEVEAGVTPENNSNKKRNETEQTERNIGTEQNDNILTGEQGVGSRLPQTKIEQIIADLQVFNSINFIAKKNNVSWETVKRIRDEYKDNIEDYREEKKMEFADKAWESIMDALKIGDRKLKLALNKSDMVEQLLEKIIQKANDEEISYRELKEDIKMLSSLANYSLRDLSTYIGTLIDKHELITGNPTSREEKQGQVTKKHVYDITQRVLNDPEQREVARQLFRRAVNKDMGG